MLKQIVRNINTMHGYYERLNIILEPTVYIFSAKIADDNMAMILQKANTELKVLQHEVATENEYITLAYKNFFDVVSSYLQASNIHAESIVDTALLTDRIIFLVEFFITDEKTYTYYKETIRAFYLHLHNEVLFIMNNCRIFKSVISASTFFGFIGFILEITCSLLSALDKSEISATDKHNLNAIVIDVNTTGTLIKDLKNSLNL